MKSQLRGMVARQLEKRVQQLIINNNVKIVGITGSVGKTSTKLAIAHVLKSKYRVLAHAGNYNSEISVPLTFFEMDIPGTLTNPISWVKAFRQIDQKLQKPYPYDIVVVEMGADQPGDIKKFTNYITPDIGVITAIQPVHLEGFGTFEAIQEEKMLLAAASKQVLINNEDKGVVKAAKGLEKVQTYGLKSADYVLPQIKLNSLGYPAKIVAAAAFAVGKMLDVSEADIASQLQSLPSVPGRMNILAGKRGSIIIDDSYNASPKSVVAALESLYDYPGARSGSRRIAVLGNMNELGALAPKAHKEVGKHCIDLDMLLTIGDMAGDYLAESAVKEGLDPQKVHRFLSPFEVSLYLDDRLKKGDVVLVKGSQNKVFAEEAVALLLANPADRQKLVRQGEKWQRRKRKQFGLK